MSCPKNLSDLLKVCSVLPVFAVLPAMAESVTGRQVITTDTSYTDLVAQNIASTTANNGGVFYMQDVPDVSLTFNGATLFSGNSLNNGGMGGAIGNGWLSSLTGSGYTQGGKITFAGASTFVNNSTNNANGGGAIFNYGLGDAKSPDIVFNGDAKFDGNKVTKSSNSVFSGGGAINHRDGMIVFNAGASFTGNQSASQGGAIMSAGDVAFKSDASFDNNSATKNGGALAILGGNATFEKGATFTNNNAGGASAVYIAQATDMVKFNGAASFVENTGVGTLLNSATNATVLFADGVAFDKNTNKSNGALVNAGSVLLTGGDMLFSNNIGTNGGGLKNSGNVSVNTVGNVLFDSNSTASSAGAFDNGGTVQFVAPNIVFTGNKADAGYGGAIFNSGDLTIGGAVNTFDNNIAADIGATKSGGGAIHNRGNTNTTTLIIGERGSINTFTANKSSAHGGAIVARAFDGATANSEVVINGATTFADNTADMNGGAIWNVAMPKGDTIGKTSIVFNGDTVFRGNSANGFGGALYNNDTVEFNGKIAFSGNSAGENGGAIYNAGTLEINGGEFIGNFAKSQAGAIYNGDGGSLIVDGATFAENKSAGSFGAVVSGTSAVKTEISNTVFRDNSAGDVGALGLFSGATLTNVEFSDNKATSTADGMDGAGALFLGAVSKTVMTNVTFDDNESALRGGAISTRSADIADNKDARLDILKSNFVENEAKTTGGAIDNYLYSSVKDMTAVYIADTAFSKNLATAGGAIYNHGDADKSGNIASMRLENVNFTGNKASDKGGAVYNEAGAGIVLSGKNIFLGNAAGKSKNDIYNDGAIKIEGGETSISGGILGDGVLDIASGAVLNIGTATVNQSLINIDGTINASVLNSNVRDNGKLFGEITGSGVINLDVSSVGTYNIFSEDNDITINVGKAYLVENRGADGVVVSTKPIDTLVKDTGVSELAAATLVGLANSTDKNVQRISLLAQQALNSGKTDVLEKESAKLNPDDNVVVQSVATATHNQVLSLAAGRMAGGASQALPSVRNTTSQYGSGYYSYYGGGRSGGDEMAQENGFWIQGLFNKSKYDEQFHSYTRGFAVGADTLIDKKYTLGAGFAYNSADVHSTTRDTDVDNKTLFVYGQYKPNKWFLNGTFAYTMSEYTEHSNPYGIMLESAYDVDMFGAQMTTGYEFASGFVPSLGLRYLHTSQDEYSNGVNTIKAMDTDYLTGVAGFSYSFLAKNSQNFQLRPELRAAATYDIVSDDAETTVVIPGVGSSYAVAGEGLAELGGEFGIGLNMRYKGMEISLMYDLGLRQDYTSQTGMIKIRSYF